MSEAVLQVTNLVKKIKGKTILDHISFEVGQGDCLALIGPNGAGKTTLMSCILGDKKASSGQVFIKGKKGKAQDQIAVLLQENTIPSQLRVKELIAFFQDISENGLSKEEIQALLQFKDDQYQQFADKLSGGQKRLLAFVLCLIGKPDILFLDEPTIGLDVSVKDNIRRAITQINQEEETTILLTTHDLSDIEQLCDRIFMIDKGQEIFDGTVSPLKETFGKMKTLSFDLTPGQNHLVSHYEGLPDMSIDRQGNTLNIEFDSSRYQSADIIKQTLSDFEVRDLKMVDTDIEDIIRRFYRKEL